MQSVTLSLIMNLCIQVHLTLNCQDRILFNKYITYNTRLTLSFKYTKKGTPCGVPRSLMFMILLVDHSHCLHVSLNLIRVDVFDINCLERN